MKDSEKDFRSEAKEAFLKWEAPVEAAQWKRLQAKMKARKRRRFVLSILALLGGAGLITCWFWCISFPSGMPLLKNVSPTIPGRQKETFHEPKPAKEEISMGSKAETGSVRVQSQTGNLSEAALEPTASGQAKKMATHQPKLKAGENMKFSYRNPTEQESEGRTTESKIARFPKAAPGRTPPAPEAPSTYSGFEIYKNETGVKNQKAKFLAKSKQSASKEANKDQEELLPTQDLFVPAMTKADSSAQQVAADKGSQALSQGQSQAPSKLQTDTALTSPLATIQKNDSLIPESKKEPQRKYRVFFHTFEAGVYAPVHNLTWNRIEMEYVSRSRKVLADVRLGLRPEIAYSWGYQLNPKLVILLRGAVSYWQAELVYSSRPGRQSDVSYAMEPDSSYRISPVLQNSGSSVMGRFLLFSVGPEVCWNMVPDRFGLTLGGGLTFNRFLGSASLKKESVSKLWLPQASVFYQWRSYQCALRWQYIHSDRGLVFDMPASTASTSFFGLFVTYRLR